MSCRFQFGLTLMALSLLFLPVDAYVTVVNAEQDARPVETQAIDEIQKLGGAVWRQPSEGRAACLLTSDAGLKKAVAYLQKLPDLRLLSVNFSPISDDGLASLKDLTQLRVVNLKVTHCTDAGLRHLEKMPRLEEINLTLTCVTDEGVAALRKALPDAKIVYSGPGDTAEANQLRGEWRGKRIAPAGEKQASDEQVLVVSGNDIALGIEAGHFKLGKDTEPATIDVEISDTVPGNNTPWSRYLGIYRLDADTLTLCLSPVYGGRAMRPTKFSPAGLRGSMYVFRRTNDEDRDEKKHEAQEPSLGAGVQTKRSVKAAENDAARTPQIQIMEKPLPTVKEAIAKAIEQTKAYQLFLSESIEIAAAKEPDGTVRVVFGRPTSDIIAAEGRLPIKPVVEVRFTEMNVTATQPKKMGQAELQEQADALAKAVRAVCSRLAVADKMEFAVRAGKDDGGFSVLVERIPYTPGAHTLYQISSDFEVVNVFAGE